MCFFGDFVRLCRLLHKHSYPTLPACKLAESTYSLLQMRSSRNFCLDVVLICIILGLGLYLFQLFKKK